MSKEIDFVSTWHLAHLEYWPDGWFRLAVEIIGKDNNSKNFESISSIDKENGEASSEEMDDIGEEWCA